MHHERKQASQPRVSGTIGEVNGPVVEAFNQRVEVVATEESEHCVSVFSPSGERLRMFQTFGSAEGQFREPCGIAVDEKENIFITDKANHCIQKFTAEEEFLIVVGTEGKEPLQLSSWNAGNISGKVGSHVNDCVQILKSDLSYFGSFGTYGSVVYVTYLDTYLVTALEMSMLLTVIVMHSNVYC